MMSAIILQPVSVAVEADQAAVQGYSGGIASSDCGTYSDHGILAVGYDSAAGYYLVGKILGEPESLVRMQFTAASALERF